MSNDFGSFIALRLRDDITGDAHSPMLKSADSIVAWIASHQEVSSWRITGTMAARLGSEWRNGGKTMNRYFDDSFTVAQFMDHLTLSGQIATDNR